MKTKWLAVFTILMMCLLSVYALADGDSEWLRSRFNNYIQLASHVGDYDGWLDISGLGGVTLRDGVSVRLPTVLSIVSVLWQHMLQVSLITAGHMLSTCLHVLEVTTGFRESTTATSHTMPALRKSSAIAIRSVS